MIHRLAILLLPQVYDPTYEYKRMYLIVCNEYHLT